MAGEIVLSTPVTNGTTIALAWTYTGCGIGVSSFDVKRKVSGGAYVTLDTLLAPLDEYVDSTAASNTTYVYQIVCNEGHASNAPTAPTMWSDTLTGTLSLSDSFSGSGGGGGGTAHYQTFTDTLTFTGTYSTPIAYDDTFNEILVFGDWVSGAQALESNFIYNYADSTGYVYLYDSVYKSDYNEIISSSWKSKKLDFADQYPQYANHNKTLRRVVVTYVDKDAFDLGIAVDADGKQEWTAVNKALGTGSGVTKRAYYHFVKTGMFFNVEITHGSKDKTFQILGIDIEWMLRAVGFSV